MCTDTNWKIRDAATSGDKPVMDLAINEEEAAWVRELFYKVVNEGASGYALAEMLNNRGLLPAREPNSKPVMYCGLSATKAILDTSSRRMRGRNISRNCKS